MKIAFCFCGEVRTGVYASENILNFIGNLLPNVDFFVHTWNKNTFKPRHPSSKKGSISPENPDYNINHNILDIDRCFSNKIVSFEVENIDTWQQRFNNQYVNFSPQWYSWYKVNTLKKHYENLHNFKYDIVVKTRLDFILPVNNSLAEEIEHVGKNLSSFHACGVTDIRINDVFFISESSVIDKAAEFVINPSSKIWYNDVFGDYMRSNSIPVKSTNINMYAIYRPESIGTSSMDFSKCHKDDSDWYDG
jgi:hypothetical protein